MTKVLILTASFGDGHNQAAYAVQEALERSGIVTKVVDYVEWLNPVVRSFAKFSLTQGVKRVPRLYGLFYRSMAKIEPSSAFQKQLSHLGLPQMRRYMKSYEPDIVASTFPTAMGVMSELRAKGLTNARNVAIVTDYTAHRLWVNDHADKYFVASEAVSKELVAFGVPHNMIEITGIPLRQKFSRESAQQILSERDVLKRQENFDPEKPVVLLMGGGSGILTDVSEWENCIRRSDAQFMIVCGYNERLYKRLEHLQSARVRVFGFCQNIHDLMGMADVMISKPGGLTLTECLAMELPILIYRPIPGQEERNAEYALSTGAAVLVRSVEEAAKFLKNIRTNPEKLQNMRLAARIQSTRIHDAASQIADSMQKLICKNSFVSE